MDTGYVQFKFASQSFSQLIKLSQNLNPKLSVKGLQGQPNFSYEHLYIYGDCNELTFFQKHEYS